MRNPFKHPIILEPDILMEKAFSRASKAASAVSPVKGKKLFILKERARISTFGNVIVGNLDNYLSQFRVEIPEIYEKMIDVFLGTRKFYRAIHSLKFLKRKVEQLSREYIRKLRNLEDAGAARKVRKEYMGRCVSLIDNNTEHFHNLNEMLLKIRRIPDFSQGPIVIIAGLPNVGKSSLLSRITGSTPEIKPYPFTTKGLMTGYWNGIQFIDTPGLLDRPMENRNEIEKQAITAIGELGDLIIYVFDAGESAGDINTQLNLFKEISENFDKPVIRVINKIDIKKEFPVDGIRVSCITGEGIEELKSIILEHLGKAGKEKNG